MHDAKNIERVAGQRTMAGFHGTELNHDLRFLIDTLGVGGIILFSRNITGREQLANLCKGADDYARTIGMPPLMIAVDQEGGAVARLKAPDFTEFNGAPCIKNEHDAAAFARTTALEMRGVGINMDMAPVMDVAPEGFDSIMADRIYSRDPGQVAQVGCTVIDQLQKAGIMAVAKHFPGIGRTALDSHAERPDLDLPLETLEQFELIPFYAAIARRVSGIMLSHVRFTRIDPEWPASLSPEIGEALLRKKMGYTGVVFTDDLEMGAIQNHYDMPVITRQVLAADVDVALICETRTRIEDAFESMCRQISDNSAFANKSERSIARIKALKASFDVSLGQSQQADAPDAHSSRQ